MNQFTEQEQQQQGNNNNNPRGKVCLLLALVGLVVIGAVAGVLVVLNVSGGIKGEDCSQDDFNPIRFAVLSGGHKEERYIKFKFVNDGEGLFFTRDNAAAKCKELGAYSWEVMSKNEWLAVMAQPEADNKAFWLHGRATAKCPDNQQFCLREEAKEGNGLKPIFWLHHDKEDARYSRLIGGNNPDDQCVFVKKTGERFWEKWSCNAEYWAACIKRNCQDPDRIED